MELRTRPEFEVISRACNCVRLQGVGSSGDNYFPIIFVLSTCDMCGGSGIIHSINIKNFDELREEIKKCNT